MNAKVFLPRNRSAWGSRTVLTALALFLASHVQPASSQPGEPPEKPIFTIIVTRHGVRAISVKEKDDSTPQPPNYFFPPWEVGDNNLTHHGYDLIKLMGRFYREKQRSKGLPVDCPGNTAFVYADTDQRTLGTAHALIEGLCDSPNALTVFHARDCPHPKTDDCAKDPIFDATERLSQLGHINFTESLAAVAAIAGKPPWPILMQHADDFARFQLLLDTPPRCPGGGCKPLEYNIPTASRIDSARNGKPWLAELKGPLGTARLYSENIFLEYAQCRPEGKMTSLNDEDLQAAMQAGMRLHVLAYMVNARNYYNPIVRGATLFAHIVDMLDQKAGRPSRLSVTTPPELDGKTLAIFSGHDTQLGALGGILNANWNPEHGIVLDDMPPGSAIVFDLVRRPEGYYVRATFASMALKQFRNEKLIDEGINLVTAQGLLPLTLLEELALWYENMGLVVEDKWNLLSSPAENDPHSGSWPSGLSDPSWTDCAQ